MGAQQGGLAIDWWRVLSVVVVTPTAGASDQGGAGRGRQARIHRRLLGPACLHGHKRAVACNPCWLRTFSTMKFNAGGVTLRPIPAEPSTRSDPPPTMVPQSAGQEQQGLQAPTVEGVRAFFFVPVRGAQVRPMNCRAASLPMMS